MGLQTQYIINYTLTIECAKDVAIAVFCALYRFSYIMLPVLHILLITT